TSEADLFITINSTQKSVPKSILVALQADLKWGASDSKDRLGAITSSLVKTLNSDPSSPLFRKLAMEGIINSEDSPLTVPEVVKGIDRAKLLGKVTNGYLTQGPLSDSTDEKTVRRAVNVINKYLETIRLANDSRWELGKAGYLCSNPGIRGHMMLLSEVIQYLKLRRHFDSNTATESLIADKIKPVLKPVLMFIKNSNDNEFSDKFSRKFGEGGVKEYFYSLCELINENLNDFGPEDFKEYISKKRDSRLTQAHQDVISMNSKLMDYVHNKLKEIHGDDVIPHTHEPKYWANGVENKNIKSKAYSHMQDDSSENKRELFSYLDFLDLKSIVKQKNNWPSFQEVFSIPMRNEKKGKTYYIDWMDTFNELRRIPAHSSSMRLYDDVQYEFLEWIKSELEFRIK
ncbi:MAG: hypothetical protein GXP21_00370, partial [Gammaproteobacteria bacterium]|nr:hypothetical protein [Gammaproteobacteria bacterium]